MFLYFIQIVVHVTLKAQEIINVYLVVYFSSSCDIVNNSKIQIPCVSIDCRLRSRGSGRHVDASFGANILRLGFTKVVA